jgi:L-threonylcarbamoyladenylate synthase
VESVKTVGVEEAARVLAQGGMALVPTETVVGLVAGESGRPRLAQAKGRDAGKPIALLCRSANEAFALAHRVPPLARTLANHYWPGPLTLILPCVDGGTVGVRVPDHPVVAALLDAYGGTLYATSANMAGQPPPRALADVDPCVTAAVDVRMEGEPGGGEASAVVDLTGERAQVLRASRTLTEDTVLEMTRAEKLL